MEFEDKWHALQCKRAAHIKAAKMKCKVTTKSTGLNAYAQELVKAVTKYLNLLSATQTLDDDAQVEYVADLDALVAIPTSFPYDSIVATDEDEWDKNS